MVYMSLYACNQLSKVFYQRLSLKLHKDWQNIKIMHYFTCIENFFNLSTSKITYRLLIASCTKSFLSSFFITLCLDNYLQLTNFILLYYKIDCQIEKIVLLYKSKGEFCYPFINVAKYCNKNLLSIRKMNRQQDLN